jgi:PTH1 family peptidyl-tRNA hydrolase
VKSGGGLAGHNGLRSITSHLSTQDYVRVRIGVGKPPSAAEGADHVLRKIPPAERTVLDDAVSRAADAVESLVLRGIAPTMNAFNTNA